MADKIYNEARKVLTTYLTDTATDLEKAKFIYDWIIWEVTYDYAATEINSTDVNEAMRYSAYHLEGVFSIEGTIFENQIAVCDGRSKAYLLMCAIEGIPCIRVAGTCYDSKTGKNAGGHAWNKVYLKTSEKDEKGAWYVVDTTWGDGKVRYGFEEVEMYTDDFFLTTDNYHNNNRNLSYTCIEDETPYDIPRAVTEYNGF
ncbi:MAG: transglutaminase domain-containing protein [Clostridia bacterium]|nr:transglutaminase domain-containing protein [Clostridia bacterium]MDY5264323.1 transglutaminase domain-containing protein [Eubacteriales bacterium]